MEMLFVLMIAIGGVFSFQAGAHRFSRNVPPSEEALFRMAILLLGILMITIGASALHPFGGG